MAEDEQAEKDDNEENKESIVKKLLAAIGKRKKIILIIILGLLLVGVSVGGTIFVLNMLSQPEEVADEVAAEGEEGVAAESAKPRAIYYPLKPPILVSFDARGRQRLLQAEITLMTRENDVVITIEKHMPMIRNALVMLIGGQIYEELQTAEGKELLRVQCLQKIQELMQAEIGKPGVEQVLFTGLILQ